MGKWRPMGVAETRVEGEGEDPWNSEAILMTGRQGTWLIGELWHRKRLLEKQVWVTKKSTQW